MAGHCVVRVTCQLRGLDRSADKVRYRIKYTEVPEALLTQGSFLSILGFAVQFLRLRLVLLLARSAFVAKVFIHPSISITLECLKYLDYLLADPDLRAPSARDPTTAAS